MSEMMESTINFEFCSQSSEKKVMHLWIPFGIGASLVLMLKIIARVRGIKPLPPSKRKKTFMDIMTPIMTVLGTAALFYQESHKFGSFLNCATFLPATPFILYALTKWVAFVVHLFFMIRSLTFWAEGVSSWVKMFTTTINIALFVEDVIALMSQHHLHAFQYLFLVNYIWPEVNLFLTTIINVVLPKHKVCLNFIGKLLYYVLLIAGSLRAAEEWDTNEGFRPKSDNSLTEMRSNWSYLYWAILQISTVDVHFTPSTRAGEFVVIVSIMINTVWFLNKTVDVYEHLQQDGTDMDEEDSCRRLIVGCKTRHKLLDFLKSFQKKGPNLMVYVDSKDTEISNIIDDLGLKAIKGATTEEAIEGAMCPGQPQDVLYFLHDDETEDLDESDQRLLDVAQGLRDHGCKATLLVEVGCNGK